MKNVYGDQLTQISECGVDITNQRIDDLDKAVIQHALRLGAKVSALDLGCGRGNMAAILGLLGLETVAIDIRPIEQTILKDIHPNIRFLQKDLAKLKTDDLPNSPEIIYSQRTLHYLPFKSTKRLLTMLVDKAPKDGRLFLSVSGINSELGEDYPKAALEFRFFELSEKNQKTHKIKHPVCLYSIEEFTELTIQCGLQPVTVFPSKFGNIKGIFFKP